MRKPEEPDVGVVRPMRQNEQKSGWGRTEEIGPNSPEIKKRTTLRNSKNNT
jgi:hypothetical protein